MARDSKPHDSEIRHLRRRRFLMVSAVASSLGLAGCTGGGSGDGGGDGDSGASGRLIMRTPGSGTMAHALANGMMTLITQETDMEGSAESGAGSTPNLVEVMRGNADLTTAPTSIVVPAYNGEEPVDVDAPHKPLQVMSFYYIRFGLMARVSDDYQYWSDLSGEPVAVGPQAAGYQSVLERAARVAMGEYNPSYGGIGEMGAQLAGGNVEAALHMDLNFVFPSHAQQITAENDVRLLGWKEENIQEIQGNPNIKNAFNSNEKYGDAVDEFATSPETFAVAVNVPVVSSKATSSEVVYTFMDALWRNKDTLTDFHGGFQPYSDESFWTNLLDTRVPIHAGAEEFLKEKNLWSDELRSAES